MRGVFAGMVLVVLGGSLWLLGGREEVDSREIRAPSPVTAPGAAAPEEDPAAPPGTPAEVRPRPFQAPAGRGPASSGGWVLRVVSASTGVPLEGAEVVVRGCGARSESVAEALYRGEAAAWEAGIRLRTGPDGLVAIPPVDTPAAVAGRSGELWGLRWLEPPEGMEPAVLRLQPAEHLNVVARHANGSPAGGFWGRLLVLSTGRDELWVTRGSSTDQDGRLVFRHVRARVAGALEHHHLEGRPEALEVVLQGAFGVDVRRRFPLDRLPREPQVMELPPCGYLCVRFTGPDGGRHPFIGAGLRLLVETTSGARESLWPGLRSCDMIPGLPCGGSVTLSISPDSRWAPREVTLPGPAAPGDAATAELPLLPPDRVVRGRLLEPEGEPVSSAALLEVGLDPGREDRPPLELQVRKGGRFNVPLPPGDLGERVAMRFVRRSRSGGSATARVILEEPPLTGTINVGDVRLADQELVVAGRVVDDLGAPRPRAAVTVVPRGDRATIKRFRRRLQADRSGCFALHGSWPTTGGIVVVGDEGIPGDVVPFTAGASRVRCVLPRTARVEGRLLLEEEVDPTTLVIRLCTRRRRRLAEAAGRAVLHVQELNPPPWRPLRAGADGTFGPTTCGTGTAELVIEAPGDPEPVLVVGGLELRPGGTCPDPRLRGLDLRGRLQTVRVRLLDARGRTVPGERVLLTPVGDAAWRGRMLVADAEGVLEFAARRTPAPVRLRPTGFPPVVVHPTPEGVPVVLEEEE